MTQFVFISHGGGPLPLLGDPNHVELIQYLRQLSQDLEALKQILVISAHWEASEIQITHHSNPPLLYTSRLYFRLLSLNRVSTIAPSSLSFNQLIQFTLLHCYTHLLQCTNQF